MRSLLLTILAMFISSSALADVHVTIQTKDFKKELQELREQGFDIAGVNLQEKTIGVIIPDEAESYFKTVISQNVVRSERLFAPDSEYKTPDEVATAVRDYASRYPNLARFQVIGTSTEGRLIWAMKISSDAVTHRGDKKVVLFDAMHHAREVMTTEVALDIVDYLLTHSEEPRVKQWLDTTEVWVVPMLNVDGNNKVWTGQSMWRKNTRGGYGVDINRNYPEKWGSCNGSSGSTGSDTYRGPSAGSEPETQALMNLMSDIKPHINISFHTYSEIVIYPMGCQGSRVDAADRTLYEGVGRELASKIVRDSGRGTYDPGTAWELLYSVDGGSLDWAYKQHRIMSYVIEFNANDFQPSYSRWRDITVERARAGWMYILDRVQGELISR